MAKMPGEDERENINNDAANHMASQTFEGETTIIAPDDVFSKRDLSGEYAEDECERITLRGDGATTDSAGCCD